MEASSIDNTISSIGFCDFLNYGQKRTFWIDILAGERGYFQNGIVMVLDKKSLITFDIFKTSFLASKIAISGVG
mgnify:CR=1 FL=1